MGLTVPTRSGKTPRDPHATHHGGEVEAIKQRWENEDGSATVIVRLKDGHDARGPIQSDNVEDNLTPGDYVRLLGKWHEHPAHGWQFAFDSFVQDVPDDIDAVAAYLAKHCTGIGSVTGKKMALAYAGDGTAEDAGDGAVRVLATNPARVVEDGWLKADVAYLASQELRSLCDFGLREAHLALHKLFRGMGFWGACIKACLKTWKAKAPDVVRRDPFKLLTYEMPGCGFLRVDQLYLRLGHPPRRLRRQCLAAWYAIRSLDGDTWAGLDEALSAVRRQVGSVETRERRAVAMACRVGLLCLRMDERGKFWVAERGKAASERLVALHAKKAMADVERVAEAAERKDDAAPDLRLYEPPAGWPTVGVEDGLYPHQAGELAKATQGRLGLLVGSPGTGKTHVAASLIKACVRRWGADKVLVCAPTGKAAVRITECLVNAKAGVSATTIHRMLGVGMRSGQLAGFYHGIEHPLQAEVVVVDEGSMLDADLAAALFAACGSTTRILIVGDPHQLPPVGHGAPLRDLIAAGVPCAKLTEIRRNSGLIVETCAAMHRGTWGKPAQDLREWEKDKTRNLVHVKPQLTQPAEGGGEAKKIPPQDAAWESIRELYSWVLTHYECCSVGENQGNMIDSVQVICAKNTTRKLLNARLQNMLNPNGFRGHSTFRTGDKVICLKNGFFDRVGPSFSDPQQLDFVGRNPGQKNAREYISNGDIGRVIGFQGRRMTVRLSSPERTVAVPLGFAKKGDEEDGGNGTREEVPEGEGAAGVRGWDLAYAVTCHKSQGSQWPTVFVVVEGSGKLGSREWLYTAASRAQTLCVVIGDGREVARHVGNVTLPDRVTFLTRIARGEVEVE